MGSIGSKNFKKLTVIAEQASGQTFTFVIDEAEPGGQVLASYDTPYTGRATLTLTALGVTETIANKQ